MFVLYIHIYVHTVYLYAYRYLEHLCVYEYISMCIFMIVLEILGYTDMCD